MLQTPVEHVLVTPTSRFHELGHFQGFCADADRYLVDLLQPEHVSFRPRSEVEEDPGFKQLIPYVILQHRDKSGVLHVFRYTRGGGQGERRLHSKLSVGIGGHISSDDAACPERKPYEEGMRRELAEEVEINGEYSDTRVGLINDDETEVGRVHLGVVHVFDLTVPDVRAREADLLDGGFVPVGEALAQLDRMETWSKICLEALFGNERR